MDKILFVCLIVCALVCSSSAFLNSNDYQKINILVGKINETFPLGTSQSNICSRTSNSLLIKCMTTFGGGGNESSIYQISISSTNPSSPSLNATDFQGFSILSQLRLSRVILSNQFLLDLNIYVPKIIDLTIDNSGIYDIPKGIKYETLEINYEQTFNDQYLSTISKIQNLFVTYGSGFNLYNDFTAPTEISLRNLRLKTYSFPDFSNVVTQSPIELTIYPSSNLDISNSTKIGNLQIKSIEFGSRNDVNLINVTFPKFIETYSAYPFDFYSNNIKWNLDRPLDLSGSKCKSLIFRDGAGLNVIGSDQYPISKASPMGMTVKLNQSGLKQANFSVISQTSSTYLNGNQITMDIPDMLFLNSSDIFARVVDGDGNKRNQLSLDVANNRFRGTIPNFFCNLWVDFSNASFIGQLPSCYTCFLNSSDIRALVKNNAFTNYMDIMPPSFYPPCTTIKINNFLVAKPKSYMPSSIINVFYIIGKDFGINSNIVAQVSGFGKNLTFSPLKYNEIYYIELSSNDANTLKAANQMIVTFVVPQISITLDISRVFNNVYDANALIITPFDAPSSTPEPSNTPSNTPSDTPSNTPSTTPSSPTTNSTTSTIGPEETEPNLGSMIQLPLLSLYLILTIAATILI